MDEMLTRIWENLAGRVGGAMSFRLILQPAVALFFGIRDGLKDARLGRPAYFWTIFADPAQRADLLHEGWKAVMKVFIMAVLIDGVYQYLELGWFYPGEALITAFDVKRVEGLTGAVGPREFGLMMITFGLVSLAAGTVQHITSMRQLRKQNPGMPRSIAALLAFLISFLGIFALIAVLFRQ